MDKKQLRKAIKASVALLSNEEKARQAQTVFSIIEQSPIFANCHKVMLFSSLPDELPTHKVIERWAKSKQVYLPRVVGDDMDAIKYTPGTLQSGSFNILEPTGNQIIPPSKLDLIIVPGVAFDRKGNRCGRGRGYYDKFLARTKAITIAVCFDCQLVDNLPVEPHDIPAKFVVTQSFNNLNLWHL